MKIKYILQLLVFGAFVTTSIRAQCSWQSINSGTTNTLNALHFPTAQNGWVVGSGGVVLRSSDGGSSWTAQTAAFGSTRELKSVHFASSTVGWVVGAGGLIKKTSNGGASWQTQTSNSNANLNDVWFKDANNGWVVGANGSLLQTANGGSTWAPINVGKNWELMAVAFNSTGQGVITSREGYILRSNDNGNTWITDTLSEGQSFQTLASSGSTWWAASNNGQVWNSQNNGSAWNHLVYAPFFSWNSVCINGTKAIWLAGPSGQLYTSKDGGLTWSDYSEGIANEDLLAVYFIDEKTGWVVGAQGKIFKISNAVSLLPKTSITGAASLCGTKSSTLNAGAGFTQYRWTGGQTTQSINVNQVGTYSVTVTNSFGCSTSASVVVNTETEELIKFYNATNGPAWNNKWVLTDPVARWFGIEVDADGCVTCIDLDGIDNCSSNNQDGSGNKVQGTFPGDFGNFAKLKFLLLANNSISGTIPSGIGNMVELESFDLSNNTQLSGTIPSSLGALKNLEYLYIQNTKVSGPIPTELGNLTNMLSLFLNSNDLIGPIPNELGNMTRLKLLSLYDNGLTGSLPSGLAKLTKLIDFLVNQNKLSGELPSWLGDFPAMEYMFLYDNKFTGAIPKGLANNLNLRQLYLNTNQFTSAPDWSKATWSPGLILNLSNNALSFDDILPNKRYSLTYAPQAVIVTDTLFQVQEGQSLVVDLKIDETVSDNIYIWRKDGDAFRYERGNNKLTFNSIKLSDGGEYRVEVTNLKASDLTLYSKKIKIQVLKAIPDTGSCRYKDSIALKRFFRLTNGNKWDTRWDTLMPMKTWYGVTTNAQGCVTSLDLDGDISPSKSGKGNGLQGDLPLLNLTMLQHLYLSHNKLSGQIPNLALSNLIELDLSYNAFTGSIPNFRLDNLKRLLLSNNYLSGIIPDFNLPNLVSLKLRQNDLTGIAQLSRVPLLGSSSNTSDSLTLDHNGFTFEDLLPNLSLINKMKPRVSYAPQDSIFEKTVYTVKEGDNLAVDLKIDATINDNSYRWTKDQKDFPPIKNNNKLSFTAITPDQAGTYQVGVSNPSLPQLTLWSRPFQIQVECAARTVQITGNKTNICRGDTVTLSTNGAGTFKWSDGRSGSSISVVVRTPSTYQVTVTDTRGCSANGNISIQPLNPPTVHPVVETENCQSTIELDVVGGSSPLNYLWSTGAKTSTLSKLKNGSYQVTVTDGKGCKAFSSIDVDSTNSFKLEANVINPSCDSLFGKVSLFLDGGKSPFYLVWQSQASLTGSKQSVIALPPGQYTIKANDANGCRDSLDLIIPEPGDCSGDFIIYNSFTPNGDGKNEYFKIKVKNTDSCPSGNINDCYPENELLIFNRWRELVYQKKGYNNDWTAEQLPAGAYFFRFYPDGIAKGKDPIDGTLTILK